MNLFEPDELKLFLESVDKHLETETELILIGGAAASLGYGVRRATVDIDTVSDLSGLYEAFRMAREETGLDVPLQRVGIFDGPYCYEERLEPLKLGLRWLRLRVPEIHDLALMKIVRGQEHDRAAISEMAATASISRDVLVERFKNEMDHVVGVREEVLRLNFLAVIEQLFGETEAAAVETELVNQSD